MLVKVTPPIYQPKAKNETQSWIARLAQCASMQNWLGQIWSTLTGRSGSLLDLVQVEMTCPMLSHHFIGRQTVLLNQIRGSASPARCHDFDANFRPRHSGAQARWHHVALARRRGAKLPPVALIKIGELYFVEDGHHRISVARAWGEKTIEAVVTVVQLAGPLPWAGPLEAA